MPRLTRAELEKLAEEVSRRLRAGLSIQVEGHGNGLLSLTLHDRKKGVRMLQTGTTRSLAAWLDAMNQTLDILGRR